MVKCGGYKNGITSQLFNKLIFFFGTPFVNLFIQQRKIQISHKQLVLVNSPRFYGGFFL